MELRGRQGRDFGVVEGYRFFGVAAKEFIFSCLIEETLLFTIYIYTHYGNLV